MLEMVAERKRPCPGNAVDINEPPEKCLIFPPVVLMRTGSVRLCEPGQGQVKAAPVWPIWDDSRGDRGRERCILNQPRVGGGIDPTKGWRHAAPKKYPEELRDRSIRLVEDLIADPELDLTVTGACRRVAEQLGINVDTPAGLVQNTAADAA